MTDFCLSPGMTSFEDALSHLLSSVVAKQNSEFVPLEHAIGRVISDPVVSNINVPPHNNSAMDGFAFSFKDVVSGDPLNIVGKAFAGRPFLGHLGQGEACWVMTGAILPQGADTVVMQEHVRLDGNKLLIDKLPCQGDCIRLAGEDIAQGKTVFNTGHVLGSADIGVLASLGIQEVGVFAPIKIALIATGDELKKPGDELLEGEIYETNGTTLKALLTRLPVEVIDFGIVPDDKEQLTQAFKRADEFADIVVASGGVSVGQADYTKDILDELGRVNFWKVAIKPGKPFAFGQLTHSWFFGLPGNPVSALVTFWQLALPAIKKVMGMTDVIPVRFRARVAENLRKSVGRMDFQRGKMHYDKFGNITVTSAGGQGSGMLSSMITADCFIQIEAERGNILEGEWVWIQPFDELLK